MRDIPRNRLILLTFWLGLTWILDVWVLPRDPELVPVFALFGVSVFAFLVSLVVLTLLADD